MIRLSEAFFLRSSSVIVFVFLWQMLSWFMNDSLLPGPVMVLFSLWQHILQEDLLHHLLITLTRVTVSFFIAMFIGTVLGIWMGSCRRLDISLDTLLIIGLNIPALVTIILCYIWFGLTEMAAITAVAINKIPTVIVTVREGTKAVDAKLLQVGDAFNIERNIKFFKIFLPQLYPYLMAAARSGLALIWKIVLVVELLGRSDGVGFKLGTFFQFFDITSILAYTLAFAMIVFMVELCLIQPLEQHLNRWRA